jgi:hypothetical protein
MSLMPSQTLALSLSAANNRYLLTFELLGARMGLGGMRGVSRPAVRSD